jgi:apolipoprotein N-acyltransferase
LQVGNKQMTAPAAPGRTLPDNTHRRDILNALLYGLVVVIWGTTWIAIFLQQGPVAAPVSIFWRFAVASVTMLTILLVTRRLRRWRARSSLLPATGLLRLLL